MSDGYTWIFDTDRQDGGIIVDKIQTDMPEYNPGASLDLRMEFWPDTVTDPNGGGTFGGSSGMTYGGSYGGVYGNSDIIRDYIERYKAVRSYAEYAGRAATNKMLDGTVRYVEHLPSNSPISSIVIPIEPGLSLQEDATDGLWVVLMGHEDQTEIIQNMAAIEFKATVLAKLSDYDSRSAIQTQLGK